jgi:hypothetical protein
VATKDRARSGQSLLSPGSEPGDAIGQMLKRNGLSIALVSLFLLAMAGQALTGWGEYNAEHRDHRRPTLSLSAYLGTGHFWEATGENWESEFLQMALFILLTTVLYQQGSAETKRPGVVEEQDLDPRRFSHLPGVPEPVRRGGWRLRVYENSLGIAFLLLFLMSFIMHAAGGALAYNDEQRAHGQPPVTLMGYVESERFWFESFQNWQSEFLSLAAMVVGTVFLRQRGSTESKAVHTAHSETGKG